MTEVLLTTLNAKYHHTALSLRYLRANLGDLKERSKILEFTIQQNSRDIAERLLAENPRIIGLSVYIWNARQTYEVVSILKKISPKTVLVLGGPEVSHQCERIPLCQVADFTIRGEGELLFRELCENILSDRPCSPSFTKWISGPLPDLAKLASPYPEYTDEDIRNRTLYVEASRGCPFKCEYCLSSLDERVRSFELEAFLADLDHLIRRGARRFKFLDRTFNLSISSCTKILRFFLDRMAVGLFIHFEMIPDRLPAALRDLIREFPAGSLQFEIGIQSWNPEVSQRVSRRQDYAKIRENFAFLTRETGAHLHADLIVGLPGETLESFAQGFDALVELEPHEIQVGILKMLRGTPIARHDQEWGMVYQDEPPYLILQTRTMDFATIQRLVRFSRYWDLIGNSGNFNHTITLLKTLAPPSTNATFFRAFLAFADFLSHRHPQGHGIALLSLVESTWVYFIEGMEAECRPSREQVRQALIEDYTGTIRRDLPAFLRTEIPTRGGALQTVTENTPTPARQRRHLSKRAD